jgi:hypothetical protein
MVCEVMGCWNRILFLIAVLTMVGCKSFDVSYGKSSLDPHSVDSDRDLLTDFEERVFTGTDSDKADTDGDGLSDGWEWFSGLDPLCSDGLDGPNGDPYEEGITNIEKYHRNPNKYKNRGSVYKVPKPIIMDDGN